MRWLLLVAVVPLALTSCPFGFVYQEQFNRCYQFTKTRRSFYMAEESCQEVSAHLVSIFSSAENSWLSMYATQQGIKGTFYTGLNRLAQNYWAWTDGSPLSYTRWAPGEPNATAQCAAENATDATWESVSCSDAYPYVCVQQLAVPTRLTCPPALQPTTCPTCPAVPGHCPSEWTYYSKTDSCYKAFLDSAFDQAETVCQSTGGHLASIHSDEENVFVSSLTHMGIEYRNEKQLTWIGLRKPNSPENSTWAWTDGSTLDYLMWAPGKPQDITGLQNCAQMYTDSLSRNPASDGDFRRWNDVQCATTMRAYVCKQAALH
uniref:C-type lectin domain-containing protein n=1 Tax=Haemonchus contortus TaxID=6289 RepID=A0A7I4YJ52_HAECO